MAVRVIRNNQCLLTCPLYSESIELIINKTFTETFNKGKKYILLECVDEVSPCIYCTCPGNN